MLEEKFIQFLFRYKLPLLALLLGLILTGAGLLFQKIQNEATPKVEILGESVASNSANLVSKITVEVAGEVNKPGVYELAVNSRVNDALNRAGGVSSNANIEWMDRFVNKAAKLSDGQKIYIPSINEQSELVSATNPSGGSMDQSGTADSQTNTVNINAASKSQLESLWGIGPVIAQNIIDQRPYSATQDLLSRKIVKQNVFDRIKNQISVY